ncbi:hypothetical protein OEZ86_006720 [Tetradesmus obliquus]|nr:hypothetical protein OEZ86_006720 [Tetradesmus obliquus]
MDPWETFGFYGALDLARAPAVLVPVLQRCGFLPGLELLAAATYALGQGAALSCVDASLKLQEAWVKTLLDNFTMDEQHVKAYQPAKDLAANEQLLPPAALAWDRQMAAAAQQLQAAVQAGAADAWQASAEQQSLLLFKDAASPLWRDRMPRSFAESVVERGGADDSTADTAGSTQQAGSAAASQQEPGSAG